MNGCEFQTLKGKFWRKRVMIIISQETNTLTRSAKVVMDLYASRLHSSGKIVLNHFYRRNTNWVSRMHRHDSWRTSASDSHDSTLSAAVWVLRYKYGLVLTWLSHRKEPNMTASHPIPRTNLTATDSYDLTFYHICSDTLLIKNISMFPRFIISWGVTNFSSHCWRKDSNGRPRIEENLMFDHNLSEDAEKFGLYRFKLHHFGEWHDVIVDDRIMEWNYTNIYNPRYIPNHRSYWPLLFTKEKK